jgi:hypothetical protein
MHYGKITIFFLSVILIGGTVFPATFAQDSTAPQAGSGAASSGGVDRAGSWYPGENLGINDYFKYELCHAEYKDCSDFWFTMWVEKEVVENNEEKLRIQVLVEDGNKVIKGYMDVGKLAPEPTGGSDNISSYRSVYKSTLAWLSAFATAETDLAGKGPKEFTKPSWGKIANIGGEQVSPIGLQTITTPAGEYDTVVIGWKTGGITSHIWVVDEFPFPVKASTWVQVTEGIPPQEYKFVLSDYQENVSVNPFANVVDTEEQKAAANCPTEYEFTKINENTNTNTMQVTIFYGPETPKIGCDLEFILEFKKSYSSEIWENQIHYDILKVDSELVPIASAASDEGRDKFFSTSGQVQRYWLMTGEPGLQKFALLVRGTGPEHIVPDSATFGYVLFDIDILSGDKGSGSLETLTPVHTQPEISIPTWIKNNAGWWSEGLIPDDAFVSGIQWLISNDIMNIPPTEQGEGSDNVIPGWIKNNAGWWSNGEIPDSAFVSGIQWLISNGIMNISS